MRRRWICEYKNSVWCDRFLVEMNFDILEIRTATKDLSHCKSTGTYMSRRSSTAAWTVHLLNVLTSILAVYFATTCSKTHIKIKIWWNRLNNLHQKVKSKIVDYFLVVISYACYWQWCLPWNRWNGSFICQRFSKESNMWKWNGHNKKTLFELFVICWWCFCFFCCPLWMSNTSELQWQLHCMIANVTCLLSSFFRAKLHAPVR